MQQKDFLLREIEKIGTLLRYLIAKLIPSSSVENSEEIIELINRELVENSGLDGACAGCPKPTPRLHSGPAH